MYMLPQVTGCIKTMLLTTRCSLYAYSTPAKTLSFFVFHICCRRQGMQRQREERFVPPGGGLMEDPNAMMRLHQGGDTGIQGRNEPMDLGQGMRPEDMNRRDGVSTMSFKRSIL